MSRNIRKMEPSVPMLPDKKRVAAYARVSSGKDAMLHSLSAQVSYYSEHIQKHPCWEYVGVYADEAVTGTKDGRAEFQRLLADCRSGKIDMVITKSISRFARNTVTMLETVREMKLLNIDIYFEKENIHSLSGDGELMLTILASFAQEESHSVSENCKWRIHKQFQNGELVNLRFMYGYQISKGCIKIEPKQAEIVRMIFADYISGMGCDLIAQKLRNMGVKTLKGGIWSAKRVSNILKNEKYAGNALLQKKYVADHLSKKLVINHGILPMYYAEDTHESIVDMVVFQKAQEIMAMHREQNNVQKKTTASYPFSGKIVCLRCGKKYKRKTTHGKIFWNCSTYLQFNKAACFTKQIPEDTLIKLTADVLGLAEFDEFEFKEQIIEMRIPEPNKVIYVFKDGHEVEAVWHDKSRICRSSDEQIETRQQEVFQGMCRL